MSSSDMKRRPLTDKRRDEIAMSDNIRNCHNPAKNSPSRSKMPSDKSSSLLKRIIDFDVHLTSKLGVCASANAPLGNFRPVMIFLEWTCHGVPWIAVAVGAILISHDRGMLEIFLNFLFALIFDCILVGVLKFLFRRNRPAHNRGEDMISFKVDDYSFPSGHATRAVMVALFLVDKFDFTGRTKTFIYTWMVVVAASRVVLGRHHVSDIAAGAIFGAVEFLFIINYLWMSQQTCLDLLQPIHEDLHL